MKVYVASSWKKTTNHIEIVEALRKAGHDVFDYRYEGFSWSQIDPDLTKDRENWWFACRCNPIATHAFAKDMNALDDAEAVVMVLPCGKSAHMELAYAIGAGKIGIILANKERDEPELLYDMADVCESIEDVLSLLAD
jgi:hypothetical protein